MPHNYSLGVFGTFVRFMSTNHIPDINQRPDPFAALRIKDFSIFLVSRFFLTLGVQIQSVVVGIQLYEITKDPLAVGAIGLSEAIPFILISLFAGHVADIVRRKYIIIGALSFLLLATWALFAVSLDQSKLVAFGTWPIYGIIFCTGIARGFLGPVFPAFLYQLVPRHLIPNAATWQSNLWQTAAVLGPAAGGILFGFIDASGAYGVSATLLTIALIAIFFVTNHPLPKIETQENLGQRLTAGFRFVFSNKVMLSAFGLDLFAVLFGGAVAMIPFFVNEVLHPPAGTEDFFVGILRAAPAVGAIVMGLLMTRFPPTRMAGRNLFIAVSGFGLCIIGFGLSTNVWLSFAILIMSGAFDSVSVVIRSTILQLLTPDHMRGRVSAVNGIFIGSSNEIGEFESGTAARLLGLVPSVIFGGSMTILIVLFIYLAVPKLRKLNLDKLI